MTRSVRPARVKRPFEEGAPGLIDTEMARVLPPEARQAVVDKAPLDRLGTPEETAAVIRCLLTDELSFMRATSWQPVAGASCCRDRAGIALRLDHPQTIRRRAFRTQQMEEATMTDHVNATNRVRAAWGGLVAVLLIAWPTARAADPALVIQGVSVFDTDSGTMKPNRTIVVSGEKLAAIGTPEQPAAVPQGAILIDGHGKFLIPGS
jgi:hypothetical protein